MTWQWFAVCLQIFVQNISVVFKLLLFLSGCNFTTVNHYKLKEHCRSHTREKILACMTCGGMFANKAKFVDHVVRQNSSGCKWFIIKVFHFIMQSLDVNDFKFLPVCTSLQMKLFSVHIAWSTVGQSVSCEITCDTMVCYMYKW